MGRAVGQKKGRDRKTAALVSTPECLPGFCHSHADHSAIEIFQDVEGRRITAAGRDSILECWMLIQEVVYGELNADVLQIIVCRVVTGVIAERQIECDIGRLDVIVIVDQAGEGSAA